MSRDPSRASLLYRILCLLDKGQKYEGDVFHIQDLPCTNAATINLNGGSSGQSVRFIV